MSLLNQLRHEAVQKGQHQRRNMCTVDIGIGHDDDLVVAELADIKIFMNTGTERSNHRFDLSIAINLV